MSFAIRVAEVSELPPGKGRVVEVAGRQFTVFNRDGRYFATTTHTVRRTPVAADSTDSCAAHGMEFDVWMQDSPARLQDEDEAQVHVEDEVVWLEVQ